MIEFLTNNFFSMLLGFYFGIVIVFVVYALSKKLIPRFKKFFYMITTCVVMIAIIAIFLYMIREETKIYLTILYLSIGLISVFFVAGLIIILTLSKRKAYLESVRIGIENLIPHDILNNLDKVDEEKRSEILQHGKELEVFEQRVKEAYFIVGSGSYIRLGAYYYLKGDYKRAIEKWKTAYEQNPDIEKMEYSISMAYISLEEYEKALLWLKKSAGRKDDKIRFDSYFWMGWIYDELERYEEAINAAYEEALKLDPDNFWVVYNEACSYAKMDDPQKTLEKLESIIYIKDVKEEARKDPDFKKIRENEEFKHIFDELIAS